MRHNASKLFFAAAAALASTAALADWQSEQNECEIQICDSVTQSNTKVEPASPEFSTPDLPPMPSLPGDGQGGSGIELTGSSGRS